MKTAFQISTDIFNSYTENGQAVLLINSGAEMIEIYARQRIQEIYKLGEMPKGKLAKCMEFRELVSTHYGINICGKSRQTKFVAIRQVLMDIFYNKECLTKKQTSTILGLSDHSTIFHGLNRLTDMLSTKDDLYMEYCGEIAILYEKWKNDEIL